MFGTKDNSISFQSNTDNAKSKMPKVMIALLPIYFLNIFYYGFNIILNVVIAIAFSFIFDNICYKIQRKSREKGDFSSIITGSIFTLLLPANVPVYIIILGCFVAICIAKAPFGGFGKNLFNPAAVAFCFVTVCFKTKVLLYPEISSEFGLSGQMSNKLIQGVSATLAMKASPNLSPFDVLLGRFSGPLGATSLILLVACGIFLIITKTINWKIPFITILTCGVFAFVFPRASVSQLGSVFYELTSGLIVFGSFFMATDPITVPKKGTSQILYAFILGILTMLFRYFGLYDLGFCFALVIVNSISATIDTSADNLSNLIDKAETQTKDITKKVFNKENKKQFNEVYFITNTTQEVTTKDAPYDLEKDILDENTSFSNKKKEDSSNE